MIKTCTLTMQLPALQMHGAVLGPLHTVRTGLLLVSSHKQLAVETHIIAISPFSQGSHFN